VGKRVELHTIFDPYTSPEDRKFIALWRLRKLLGNAPIVDGEIEVEGVRLRIDDIVDGDRGGTAKVVLSLADREYKVSHGNLRTSVKAGRGLSL